MPAIKRPVTGESDGMAGKNFDPTTPSPPSRASGAMRIGADKIAQTLMDTPPGDTPLDDQRTPSDNPFNPPEQRAEPALFHYDCPIRIPADFPYIYIPQDNAAFLLFVAAMKPTLSKVIQADPKFPHGQHDTKIECEFRLESFICHMLDQDPAFKTPRWQTYNSGMPVLRDPVYAVWFVRRLIDYLKVNRRRRRRGLRAA